MHLEINTHKKDKNLIAEIINDEVVLPDIESGSDVIGQLYFDGFDGVIIYQEQLSPAFFDLSTKFAGELLQKFSNFRLKLVIVLRQDVQAGASLKSFINESNRYGQIRFVDSLENALHNF